VRRTTLATTPRRQRKRSEVRRWNDSGGSRRRGGGGASVQREGRTGRGHHGRRRHARRPSRLSEADNDQRQYVANRLLEQLLDATITAMSERLLHRQQERLFYGLQTSKQLSRSVKAKLHYAVQLPSRLQTSSRPNSITLSSLRSAHEQVCDQLASLSQAKQRNGIWSRTGLRPASE